MHRLLVFVQMAAVAAIGLSVSDAFGDLSAQLAIAYAIVRAMLFTMFMRVKGSHPHSADVSTAYQVGFGVGIGLFLGAPVLSPDVRWIVWLLAIAFEIVYFARPSSMAATRTEQISALDLDNADRQAIGIVEDPKLVKA